MLGGGVSGAISGSGGLAAFGIALAGAVVHLGPHSSSSLISMKMLRLGSTGFRGAGHSLAYWVLGPYAEVHGPTCS